MKKTDRGGKCQVNAAGHMRPGGKRGSFEPAKAVQQAAPVQIKLKWTACRGAAEKYRGWFGMAYNHPWLAG